MENSIGGLLQRGISLGDSLYEKVQEITWTMVLSCKEEGHDVGSWQGIEGAREPFRLEQDFSLAKEENFSMLFGRTQTFISLLHLGKSLGSKC